MNALAVTAAVEPLARTSEGSKSGPIGLAIILLMCIACYFLFKSMSRHLKRVREEFPTATPAVAAPAAPAAPAASVAPAVPAAPAASVAPASPQAVDLVKHDATRPDGSADT